MARGLLLGGYLVERGDRTEVHVILADEAPPRPSRTADGHRRQQRDLQPGERGEGDLEPPSNTDAAAGAPGEWRTEREDSYERWDDPPLWSGGHPDAPQTAVINPERAFLDARSLRISGRDQEGRPYSAAVWGPPGVAQNTPWTNDPVPTKAPPTVQTGDCYVSASHVDRLGQMARFLDQHYRRR